MDSRDDRARLVSLVSGFCSGFTRVLIGHPFDTAKVLVQTNRGGSRLKYSFRSLYQGVTPNLVSVGISTSISFWLYENARLSLLNRVEPQSISMDLGVVFASGTFAGSVLCMVTCPLENVKIIQQVSTTKRSTVDWLVVLLKQGTTHRGIVANFVQAGVGRGFYLGGYAAMKRAQGRLNPNGSEGYVSKFVAASFAGVCGWVFTFPFDVVRSNMMADWQRKKYTGAFQCLKSIYAAGGIPALYSGIGYTLVRAVPVACVALPSYDIVQTYLLSL